jgi:hypothetical protein
MELSVYFAGDEVTRPANNIHEYCSFYRIHTTSLNSTGLEDTGQEIKN